MAFANMGGKLGVGILGLILVALAAVMVAWNSRSQPEIDLTATYHAVLLTNGQAFFGKLEKAGSAYPVLRDVYYLHNEVNPETNQVSTNLIKRGTEIHAPDMTVLNASHILLIEPVSPGSQVAKRIEEESQK